MDEKARDLSKNITEWVTFRLGSEKYGVNVMMVREVLKNIEITPVPGAPAFVLGIINLRGNVVTVIDTRMRFALPEKETDDNSRIMIIEEDGEVVGMLVDSVAEVATLSDSDIELAPNVGNDESSKYIYGVTKWNDDLLILVELHKFLSLKDYREAE
jgi:purine-binding chemotaxis protein CheW